MFVFQTSSRLFPTVTYLTEDIAISRNDLNKYI